VPPPKVSHATFPFVKLTFADSAYGAERVARAIHIIIEIVSKRPDQAGIAIHPSRRVVERLFAWIDRNHRLATDLKATIASAEAFLSTPLPSCCLPAAPQNQLSFE
jgi:hypothetical protein